MAWLFVTVVLAVAAQSACLMMITRRHKREISAAFKRVACKQAECCALIELLKLIGHDVALDWTDATDCDGVLKVRVTPTGASPPGRCH